MHAAVSSPVVTALVQGPDRPGIIATITSFIFRNHGNIIYLDQHTDTDERMFFMRVQFELAGFALPVDQIPGTFSKVCGELGMALQLFFSAEKRRVAVMVSHQGHCLTDLLYRWKSGHLDMDLVGVISNHGELRDLAEYYQVPYHHFPVLAETRHEQERQVLSLLHRQQVDTVILARYMQILSPPFVQAYPSALINIHHSFLPAFAGANPYQQAFQRGVKIIGATSHYVTEELDQGPIIAQDVVQISHRDSVEDMKRKGQDMEKLVLAKAVALHLGNRIIVHNNKTIIFAD